MIIRYLDPWGMVLSLASKLSHRSAGVVPREPNTP